MGPRDATAGPTARSRWLGYRPDPIVLTSVLLVAVWGYSLLRVEGYRSLDFNLFTLRVTAFLAVVAVGQTLVVLMGGIDLSVAATISLSGVVGGNLIGSYGQAAGILATLAIAAAVGAANGVGIVTLRLPPLVMTLASLSIIQGGLLIYNAGNPVGGNSALLARLANGDVAGLPNPVLVLAVTAAAVLFLLHRTAYGRAVYAVGTNPLAAELSGVPVARVQVATYALCGLFAGLTGLLILGWTGYSYLNMGDPYLLSSIAAVVVGGTSILGGRGKLAGTLLGALLLSIFVNILTVLKIPEAGRIMVQGGLILLLLLAYALVDETR